MVTFIIIRHGYSVGNKEKRFSGQMDISLDYMQNILLKILKLTVFIRAIYVVLMIR